MPPLFHFTVQLLLPSSHTLLPRLVVPTGLVVGVESLCDEGLVVSLKGVVVAPSFCNWGSGVVLLSGTGEVGAAGNGVVVACSFVWKDVTSSTAASVAGLDLLVDSTTLIGSSQNFKPDGTCGTHTPPPAFVIPASSQ